jgi:GT2 family glycosyltransferase
MNPKVYIILLNYKNWQDTLECLLSLNKQSYANFETVVVDNNSGNDSLQQIQARLRDQNILYPVHYMQSEENGGFAKGNNVGIKFARERKDGKYFWVLNNDTVIATHAISELVKKASKDEMESVKVGIYGSKLLYHTKPNTIQAVGGNYNKWLGTLIEIGNLKIDKGQYDYSKKSNMVIGAAMFVSDEFIQEVGLLGEEYFLYFEEVDWVERAKRKGWSISTVTSSIVFHKQGVSTQANGLKNAEKSKISDYYYFKNRILITKKYFPYCLPSVYASYIITAFNRIKRGQWDRLGMMWDIIF